MQGRPFTVPVEGGEIGGCVNGSGLPVLVLHNGPGLSFDHLDGLASEIGDCVHAALGRLVTA